VPWSSSPHILAESLAALDEPLALLLTAGPEVAVETACRAAARALLDLPARVPRTPPWLAPHQIPACERLLAILDRFGGAVLADAVGLGKSYVAMAIARVLDAPLTVVVPAVLLPQWRSLMDRLGVSGGLRTHESLSRDRSRDAAARRRESAVAPLVIVDEAHRFREPQTHRYRALARFAVGARVLLVTATPVHNRPADLVHLLRLFLRDDALVGLGVPSLARVARDPSPSPAVLPALARLLVARSRRRVAEGWEALRFPSRQATSTIRVAPVTPALVSPVVDAVRLLRPGGGASALFRLMLLRRFASSVPALMQSLRRYEAFCAIALEAAQGGRRLGPREFQSLFPTTEGADLQLAFLPLLLEESPVGPEGGTDLEALRSLVTRLKPAHDPKVEALARLLADRPGKTIVFTTAAATVHHLRRRLLRGHRVGAAVGRGGWLGADRVSRQEVLEAFAPHAQRAAAPSSACVVDVLLATDLLSEGLDLQDARRVIHYDLPWSPARLAQRVGRIDRLASGHRHIETVAFLPPEPLAHALALERRLATKVAAQLGAGAAQVERISGVGADAAPLDWCDRLQQLAGESSTPAPPACAAAVTADVDACVLIVRLGGDVEAVVIEDRVATSDPVRATTLLAQAVHSFPRPLDRATVSVAIRAALPLLHNRLKAIAAARWRSADRDHFGRRLVPLALAAARRAARRGQHDRLARLDALLSRLTGGQTAGESLQLDELVTRRSPLGIRDLLAWHDGLPPLHPASDAPLLELISGVVMTRQDTPGDGTPRRT
jgi:superfamily II DNA or RNA helicase